MNWSIWLFVPAVMFDITQHISRRILFFSLSINFENTFRMPYLSNYYVWSSLPTEMLPKILNTGVSTFMSSFPHKLMNFSTAPVSMTLWILDFVLSHPYEMAHKESIKVYLSKSPAFKIMQSWVIPFLIKSYFGKGTPRQRFDNVHATCLIRFLSFVEFEILTRC